MSDRLSPQQLNRATLQRQGLLERFGGTVSEVIGGLAGLQAQHANSPYVALWSRRKGQTIGELEQSLTSRNVVKATLMRSTLHLVDGAGFHAYDVAAAGARVANWAPSARKAGLDLLEVNQELLAYCSEPRTVADIEEHLADLYSGKLTEAAPAGVRNTAFRMASAAGGLVHVPPSGLWKSHGKPSYVAADRWLAGADRPSPLEALALVIRRFLGAYGPASVVDMMKFAGLRKVTEVRAALAALGDDVVRYSGPTDEAVDLASLEVPPADAPAPARFLSRWDSVLIAYDNRDRILPPDYKAAVIKKNGDFLPTFLVDGLVAGLWAVESGASRAVLRLEPFRRLPADTKKELEAEGEALVRYVEPEAVGWTIEWVT